MMSKICEMLQDVILSVLITGICVVLCSFACRGQSAGDRIINMVFTSDAHYGITRPKFRGDSNAAAYKVNEALIRQVNTLPGIALPADNGIGSGKHIGAIDYVVEGGDIANRMQPPVQSAAASWAQFENDYLHLLSVKGHNGQLAKLFVIPGNHDISNAIGFAKPMKPLTDPTSMVKIYNMMLKPAKPLTNENYDYAKNKVDCSYNMKGIHVMFITLWPDSAQRIWMQKDLDTVNRKTPVIIFTHDQPESEAKHFTNPVPPHNMTVENGFENLVAEHYKDGIVAPQDDGATIKEQRGLVKFLQVHPNIKAYFHGNSNWNEFYVYHGPDNLVSLPVFRVDSPMKGRYSSRDETLLSFQLISIDPQTQTLTVRECLWNTKPADLLQKVVFGKTSTVSLKVN